MSEHPKQRHIDDFVSAIEGLSKANRLTGLWDNKRFQLCKKPFTQFNEKEKAYLYQTEKESRRNVELRALYRKQIDISIKGLISN